MRNRVKKQGVLTYILAAVDAVGDYLTTAMLFLSLIVMEFIGVINALDNAVSEKKMFEIFSCYVCVLVVLIELFRTMTHREPISEFLVRLAVYVLCWRAAGYYGNVTQNPLFSLRFMPMAVAWLVLNCVRQVLKKKIVEITFDEMEARALAFEVEQEAKQEEQQGNTKEPS